MLILETFKRAIRSLMAKRLRTLLTMLGIVVGVGSVLVLLAYGEGTRTEMLKRFESWGAKQIYVQLVYSTWRLKNPVPRNVVLTYGDVAAIRNECSAIRTVVPVLETSTTVTYRNQSSSETDLIATESGYFEIADSTFAEGRSFTTEENLSCDRVCVLGGKLKELLFFAADAQGKYVTVNGRRFLVVGVLAQRETDRSWMGTEVYLPYLTAQSRMSGFPRDMELTMEATEMKYIDLATRQVEELLRQRHPQIPPAEDPNDPRKNPLYVRSTQSWKAEREAVADSFSKLLMVIGALSLLIGGVGVMNIMLVTVHERTREIGLRKALGARRRDILLQFLMEAVLVCIGGGALGLVFALLACRWLANLPDEANVPDPIITTAALWIAIGITLGTGLFFGVYPAARAARLNPIDALHYE